MLKPRAFLRSVAGTVTPAGRIESLALTSSDGSSCRVGTAKTLQKHFNLEIGAEELPVCVYGSLLVGKEPGRRETCELEFLGFEIQHEANLAKAAPIAHMSNEFILE